MGANSQLVKIMAACNKFLAEDIDLNDIDSKNYEFMVYLENVIDFYLRCNKSMIDIPGRLRKYITVISNDALGDPIGFSFDKSRLIRDLNNKAAINTSIIG